MVTMHAISRTDGVTVAWLGELCNSTLQVGGGVFLCWGYYYYYRVIGGMQVFFKLTAKD
jgi:hypothetical protein